jgi:hypothetical protein
MPDLVISGRAFLSEKKGRCRLYFDFENAIVVLLPHIKETFL